MKRSMRRGTTNPQDIINRELGGITQELAMNELTSANVSRIENGETSDIYKKQRDVTAAIELFRERNTVILHRLGDDENRDVYQLLVQGKKPMDRETEIIFKMPKGAAETKFFLEMLVRVSGGLS